MQRQRTFELEGQREDLQTTVKETEALRADLQRKLSEKQMMQADNVMRELEGLRRVRIGSRHTTFHESCPGCHGHYVSFYRSF